MDGTSSQRAALEAVARDHTETQNNLRQATAALDSAFRRIRQLRHSILELADSIPSQESTTRIRNISHMGPAHEAILLSDSTAENQDDSVVPDMARLRSTLPPVVMESLERYEAEQEGRSNHFPSHVLQPPVGMPSRQSSSSRTLHSTSPPHIHNSSITGPSRDPILPRRSWLETQISRPRAIYPDDVSTTLGMRVAAREARGGQTTADDLTPQLEQIILNTTPATARSVDDRSTQRMLGLDQTPEHRRPLDADIRTNRIMDGYIGRESQSPGIPANHSGSGTSVLPSRPVQSRRWRAVRSEAGARQASTVLSMSGALETSVGTSARLSALSNFSTFDNFGTPSTPLSRERPILFDEPHSYVHPPNLPTRRRQPEDITEGIVADNRSYLVRRRLNADGDELVHNISLSDWDEDDLFAWLRPARERISDPAISPRPSRGTGRTSDGGIYFSQRSGSPTNQMQPDAPRRRRGWGASLSLRPCCWFH
jgi:hypothetical protein